MISYDKMWIFIWLGPRHEADGGSCYKSRSGGLVVDVQLQWDFEIYRVSNMAEVPNQPSTNHQPTTSHISVTAEVGSKVKCRVLHVHLKRRQLTLTAKKSLVQSDFQLTNTADAKVNMLVTGYISKMIDAGAIVQFYGGARGWRRAEGGPKGDRRGTEGGCG